MLKTDTRQANWRRANPGKYEAHLAVQRAMKAGDLEKQGCEVCGTDAVDAHHDQYDEPLTVRWLCRRHHTRLHHYGEDMFPIGNALEFEPFATSILETRPQDVRGAHPILTGLAA